MQVAPAAAGATCRSRMTTYIIRRVLWVFPVLWAVATITFFLMHAVPGGPFTQDKKVAALGHEALERRYHFDEPLWKQYTFFLWNSSHGDLGLSVRGDRDVTNTIRRTFFVTAQFGDSWASSLAVTVGMSLGTLSALNHNGPLDYVGVGFATIFASVPNFILGAFLVVVFAVNWQIFDVLGWGGPIELETCSIPSVVRLAQGRSSRRRHQRVAGGVPRPRHARERAGGVEPGLHPHGARERRAGESRVVSSVTRSRTR